MKIVPQTLGNYIRCYPGPIHASVIREIYFAVVQMCVDLHAAGLLHRDIKPDNVLVSPRRSAHLIDFGLVGPVGLEDDFVYSIP